jgi:hypothetical protein
MKIKTLLFTIVSVGIATHVAAAQSDAVRDAWKQAQYRFTPQVEAAFLATAKVSALQKLAAAGKTLPAEFLAWIDSDPIAKTTVYGARRDPAGILLNLRALEIDLGQQVVRKKYTQLALAMAVVHAKDGDKADLSPRSLLVLHISGDPRKQVDTHDKNRPLDVNDHIINFLNDHPPIVEDVVVGYKETPPELKYDKTGKAIPAKKAKPKKEPVTEKRPRPLRAADVIASAELEKEFNDYMKAHGQTAQIHCGGLARLNWKSTTLQGVDTKGAKQAYELLLAAYRAKGYMPPERDPAPTLAERCAFLIRNNEYALPPEKNAEKQAGKKITWPKFPLTAPWPVMTMLAADTQPLREREDIWQRYRDKGEFHGYGEYVGSIAQAQLYLQARRLAPYAFDYGSVQMMLKDGGVCGTMANIAVRSHLSLGTPASTAGQPGHCALVLFAFNDKDQTYRCQGGQYATAGDAGTHVHVPWFFGDVDGRKPMVYHQTVAWSVNCGFPAYLDSMAAHAFYKQLSDADRKAHGGQLLQSAAELCPYNFLIPDDALDAAARPGELIAFWKMLKPLLASGKAGCPADGLYNTTIKDKLFARLAVLPVPAEAGEARAIEAFLREENCANQAALAVYKIATTGLPALLAETKTAFTKHLASVRSDAACAAMADALTAAAAKIADKKQRRHWASDCWQQIQGTEKYFGHKGAIATDKSVVALAKLAGKSPRSEKEQVQSFLDQITARLKAGISGRRNPQDCKQLAGTIAAAARQVKDDEQKQRWLDGLARVMSGKETYRVAGAKKGAKPQRDPCADTIKQLRSTPTSVSSR